MGTSSLPKRSLSLALQGGGSFGAFTWGVLDRLLEEPGVSLDTISGASAGAVNAVLLADGLAAGGPEAARAKLRHFWTQVAHSGPQLPLGAAALLQFSARVASPYQLNPLGINPMRGLLTGDVDFERVRTGSPVHLMIATTRVSDGRLRLFREHEVSLDVVLASACLPMIHHAVEIDGEAYWDGGYAANPPLRQLVVESNARDVILVQLMPDYHTDVPHSSRDISLRMQEIAFATSLHKELESLDDLRALCGEAHGNDADTCRKLRRLRFHRIGAGDYVEDLDHLSALDTRESLLISLHDAGRRAAAQWLAANPADAALEAVFGDAVPLLS
ncbi:MAG: patatin-like phospholipase family protein [Acetobacteraceae bacterium]|nr:patatin-like phospholipase family protein [Acetobacteraceae bacterium]